MGIDMREELETLIRDYGLTALYVRENRLIRCKCYNPLHRTGDAKCTICGGFGHLTTIEPIKFVYDRNYYMIGNMENGGSGSQIADSLTMYVSNKSLPKVKDRVYIAKWFNGKPEEIQRVYMVSTIDDMRMDNGRVEGYMVTAKARPDLLKDANRALDTLTAEAKNTLSRGGRYIWPYNSTQS